MKKQHPITYEHLGKTILVLIILFIIGSSFMFWFNPKIEERIVNPKIEERIVKEKEEMELLASLDTFWMGESLDEVRANCVSLGGTFSSALFNHEDFEFHAVCLWRDRYYKVYIPPNERPKHPCMIELVRDTLCDNF